MLLSLKNTNFKYISQWQKQTSYLNRNFCLKKPNFITNFTRTDHHSFWVSSSITIFHLKRKVIVLFENWIGSLSYARAKKTAWVAFHISSQEKSFFLDTWIGVKIDPNKLHRSFIFPLRRVYVPGAKSAAKSWARRKRRPRTKRRCTRRLETGITKCSASEMRLKWCPR